MFRTFLLLSFPLLLGCVADAAVPETQVVEEDAAEEDAVEDCASSCTQPAKVDGRGVPTQPEFLGLLADWSAEPIDSPSLALETLLFHGQASRQMLLQLPPETLSETRREFLLTELARNHAAIELRIIDEEGLVRGELRADQLGLNDPAHRHLSGTGSLGEVELSGRVRRVGLQHIWSRW